MPSSRLPAPLHTLGRRAAALGRQAGALCAALACLAAPLPLTAASGGPDTYGYTWRDSAEPGIAYTWEDITLTGQDITRVADDDNTGLMALSFPFPYYGLTFTRLAACTNGWASLVDGGNDTYDNTGLPDGGGPTGTLAPYWDDFNLEDAGEMWFQDFGDHAVLSWIAVPFYADDTQTATFQLVLHADGRIVAQYQDIQGPADSGTCGIESPDDVHGLTAWFDMLVPRTAYAVQFDPPAPLPMNVDCAGATPLACGDDIQGDLALGQANQDTYRCLLQDFSGREQVYVVDLPFPTTARFVLEPQGGNPTLFVLPACYSNSCSIPAGGLLNFVNGGGRFYLVVDCPPGQEAPYRLRAECLPLATQLDCSMPPLIDCGARVTGDLAAGTANQDSYWCSLADYSGSEQLYAVEFTTTVPSVTIDLMALSGDPDLIVIYPCDANACLGPPGDSVTLTNALGLYYLIVDSAPGMEGSYEIWVHDDGAPPLGAVGNTLRVTDYAADRISFAWTLAAAARPGEEFLVWRSERPDGGFVIDAVTRTRAYTDSAATATGPLPHVWHYLVGVRDQCGNLTLE